MIISATKTWLIKNNPNNESYIAEASQPIKVSIRIIHKLIMKINHYLYKLLSVLNKQHYCDTHFALYFLYSLFPMKKV